MAMYNWPLLPTAPKLTGTSCSLLGVWILMRWLRQVSFQDGCPIIDILFRQLREKRDWADIYKGDRLILSLERLLVQEICNE